MIKQMVPLNFPRSFTALLLAFVFCFCGGLSAQSVGAPVADGAFSPEGEEYGSIPSSAGMVELADDVAAFRLYGLSVTTKDYRSYLQGKEIYKNKTTIVEDMDMGDFRNGMNPDQQRIAKNMLWGIIRQQCLLRLADEAHVTVTEEDKKHYVALWIEQNSERNVNDYLAQFPLNPQNPLQLSRENMFRLLKYTDSILESVEVPAELIAQNMASLEQEKVLFEQQEAQQREEFRKLSQEPGFNTDEGFMALAKKHSDGAESVNGGVIDTPMTRKEIRECNDGQPFNTKVGESSELFETESSLRYIRVLEKVPGKMAGEPPKFRIAQILFAKREINHMPTEEEVMTDLRYKIQEKAINEKISGILHSDAFECPLFPDLLDDMGVK